jgi:heme exporter protein B
MEMRSSHNIASLVLFALASVYTAMQVVGGKPDPSTWNAMAWIILMFTAFNSAARLLPEDLSSVRTYTHWTIPPRVMILARTLHHALVMAVLSSLLLFFTGLFLGSANMEFVDMMGFLAGMILTAVALASTLTLLSALSARAGAGYGLTAILGLPLIIPIVLISTQFGSDLISGIALADTAENLLFLGVLSIGISIFGYVLFPYLWRS